MSTAIVAFSPGGDARAEEQNQIKIRWLLAHDPARQFERAAKHFRQLVEKDTDGKVTVDIVNARDINGGKSMDPQKVYEKLAAGEVEMSQMYTTSLGRLQRNLWVLDLPYLFRNHDHATKVLEGQVGKKLLASLSANKLTGLAFTYSGGFRVMSSKSKELRRLEDFKGIRVRTSESPVAMETFMLLQARPIPMSLEDGRDGIKTGFIESSETTEARYWDLEENKVARVLNETEHSLFLTAMVISKDFMDKIPSKYKDAIHKAAFEAARVEREVSIKDGEDARKMASANGVKIVNMSVAERDRMREATQPVYAKFESLFGRELITSIKEEK